MIEYTTTFTIFVSSNHLQPCGETDGAGWSQGGIFQEYCMECQNGLFVSHNSADQTMTGEHTGEMAPRHALRGKADWRKPHRTRATTMPNPSMGGSACV